MSDKEFLLDLAGIFARHSIREMNRAEDLELSASSSRADADHFNYLATKMMKKAVYGENEDANACEEYGKTCETH